MRVVYSYFLDNELKHVLDYLHEHHQWEPVFIHGQERMRLMANQHYPQAIFHDSYSMRQARFDYSRLGSPTAIDAKLIKALAPYESNFLSWLEDSTGWNFSFHERRRFYYELLQYWQTVVEKIKPEAYIAYTFPHVPSDFVFYLMCKHYYGIPVVFMNPLPYLYDDYFTMCESLEDLSRPFDRYYLSNEELPMSGVVQKYLDHLRGPEPTIPQYITRYWVKLDDRYRRRYLDYVQVAKQALKGLLFKRSVVSFKKNQDPWSADSSKMTNWDYFLFKQKLTRTNKALGKYYHQHVAPLNTSEKFIYFPGPYQPEVFSNLMADVYEDIFLIMDMLVEVMPKDWLIYYKEHPNSFKEADKGGLMRSKHFYDRLRQYPQVRLMDVKTNTYQLIDASKAVCTVGGTAGWEAVVRHKPAIVFGHMWYQTCRSIMMIRHREELREAMHKIVDGFKPSTDDVNRFAQAIFLACEHGLIDSNDFPQKIKASKDPVNDMHRLAQAFYRAFKQYYPHHVSEKKQDWAKA